MMAEIEIYSTKICPYCVRAKRLLDKKNARYREIDVTDDEPEMMRMIKRSGGRQTVPQIFIDGVHVGGCDDLHALDAAGKLDPMLSKNP